MRYSRRLFRTMLLKYAKYQQVVDFTDRVPRLFSSPLDRYLRVWIWTLIGTWHEIHLCVTAFNIRVHARTRARVCTYIYIFRYMQTWNCLLVVQVFNYSLQLTCKQLEPSLFYNARRMSHHSVIGHSSPWTINYTHSKLYGLSRVRKTRIFVVWRARVRYDIYVMISVYVTRFTR